MKNQLTIKLNDFKAGMNLIMYDVLGQMADKIALTGPETIYNRTSLARGLYTFKVTLKDETLQSGKIVFE
jgi:hypothetical protein